MVFRAVQIVELTQSAVLACGRVVLYTSFVCCLCARRAQKQHTDTHAAAGNSHAMPATTYILNIIDAAFVHSAGRHKKPRSPRLRGSTITYIRATPNNH